MGLKNNQQRGKNAIILIWIVMGFFAINLVSYFISYLSLKKLDPTYFNPEKSNQYTQLLSSLEFLYLIAYIVSAVIFIKWFRRAYYNLHVFKCNLTYSEGYAAGGWFIPFFNLYGPYRVMKDIFENTKLLFDKYKVSYEDNLETGIVGTWWALWVFLGIFTNIINYLEGAVTSLDDILLTYLLSMFSNLVGILLSFVTISMLKKYTSIEHKLFELKDDFGTPLHANIDEHLVD